MPSVTMVRGMAKNQEPMRRPTGASLVPSGRLRPLTGSKCMPAGGATTGGAGGGAAYPGVGGGGGGGGGGAIGGAIGGGTAGGCSAEGPTGGVGGTSVIAAPL